MSLGFSGFEQIRCHLSKKSVTPGFREGSWKLSINSISAGGTKFWTTDNFCTSIFLMGVQESHWYRLTESLLICVPNSVVCNKNVKMTLRGRIYFFTGGLPIFWRRESTNLSAGKDPRNQPSRGLVCQGTPDSPSKPDSQTALPPYSWRFTECSFFLLDKHSGDYLRIRLATDIRKTIISLWERSTEWKSSNRKSM